MNIWARVRRELRHLAPSYVARVRVARIQACRLNGYEVDELKVVADPKLPGAYVCFRDPNRPYKQMMVWTAALPIGWPVRLAYSKEAERRLIVIHGRDEYLFQSDSYLRVA